MSKIIHLPSLVGMHYKDFWYCEKMYVVLKGGRASKKTVTTTLRWLTRMMKFYHEYGLKPNLLVIRQFYNTHKDSTRADLIKSMDRLGVRDLWKIPASELTLTYKPSGQKILFRGMDDPDSITGIAVENGVLPWVWWEEAFQINNEDAFDKVDGSIRGNFPHPIKKQHVFTMNPWSEKTWIRRRFFDLKPDDPECDDVFTKTTNYMHNEHLSVDDRRYFENMKQKNPRRYAIEGLGEWGVMEGLIYTNWREEDFSLADLSAENGYRDFFGLDFGWTDPTTLVALKHKKGEYKIYVYDEIYSPHLTNNDIISILKERGYDQHRIMADSGEPKTIRALRDGGIPNIKGAKKPAGSVVAGIKKLQDYEIIIHPRCKNVINEMHNYVWKPDPSTGKSTDEPIDDHNHAMDALRYATERLESLEIQFG